MAKIDSISPFGEVEISFNATMMTHFSQIEPPKTRNLQEKFQNLSIFDENVLKIEVLPVKYRQFFEDFDPLSLNLTWKVTKFEPRKMTIKLNFTNPLAISPDLQADNLSIEILNTSYFVSEYGKEIDKNYTKLISKIRKQVFDTKTERSA